MRKITPLAAALLALAIPSTATAKNFKQSGYVVGDKAATVKLRVKASGARAVKVGGFKAKNVRAKCKTKEIRIQLTALEPVPVARDGGFSVRLGDGAGGVLKISGQVLDGGRATKGSIKTNEFQEGDDTCRVAKQKFKTSVR